MKKSELIQAIASKAGLTQAQAHAALDATMETVKETLAKGDGIALTGFATISVGVRPAREGRNPLTGSTITIPEKKIVKFKAGSDLSSAIN